MRTLLVLLTVCISEVALADGFAMFSKHEDLKNKVVIEAGEAEQIKIETDGRRKELIKLNGKCYDPVGFVKFWRKGQAALLLSDRYRVLSIAVIESEIGSIQVEVFQVGRSGCPEEDNPSDDMQKTREFLKKNQDDIQKGLEEFKKRK